MDAPEEFVDDCAPELDPLDQVTAVILAGGRGIRMGSSDPKVLADIAGVPLIVRSISQLRGAGISRFHVCLGYGAMQVRSHLDKLEGVGHSDAGEHTSMGERLAKAYEHIGTPYSLVCYGDTVANVNIREAFRPFINDSAAMSLTLSKLKSDFGVVELVDEQIRIINEKPTLPYWINIGYILCQHWTFLRLTPQDSVVDWVNRIAKQDRVIPHYHGGFHYTINTQRDRDEVSKIFSGVTR